MLRNVGFRQELGVILDGIDEETLNQRLNELLNANLIIEYQGKAKLTNLPNYSERRKALDIILELSDMYPARRTDERKVNIDMEMEKMSKEEIGELLKDLYSQTGCKGSIEDKK